MMIKPVVVLIAIAASTLPAFGRAKNVILFVGDGAGISSLNAASIYGYGKPRALYIQQMPYLALADTSSAKEWVTDGAACASAWATGHKTRNGVVSMSDDAERDVKDGKIYKTVMEYAMEQGLATGVISNEDRAGVADAAVSAVSLEDEHTAEEVPVLAAGPGSDSVHGYISNTDVFHIMMSAFAWDDGQSSVQ
ncbi:MAG TPA: alkaline phosphatase [Bryobacteraceae bacterium]